MLTTLATEARLGWDLSAECSNAVTYLCEYAQVRNDDLNMLMETRRLVSRSNSRCSCFVKEALE